MKFKYIFLILLLFISSCRIEKPVVTGQSKADTIIKEKTIITDTVFIADSAVLRAFLQCDSIGLIYITQLKQLQGDYIRQSINLKDNELIVQSRSLNRLINYSQQKDSTIKNEKIIYKEKAVEKERPLSFWLKAQIYTFRILFIFIVLSLIFKYSKKLIIKH